MIVPQFSHPFPQSGKVSILIGWGEWLFAYNHAGQTVTRSKQGHFVVIQAGSGLFWGLKVATLGGFAGFFF